MKECRAALRWSLCAVFVALVSVIYSTWYMPGLIDALDRLSDLIERQEGLNVSRTN